ncbi:hypothetical protein GCK72_016602 [Caenorhabditis remanei]|uniref:F-box domain-containing protein n=1 Tax=Caenorhabditis remanei TaxID=31234 RepID=A0A6A5G5A5_CAERE|nr:hypothetical protein GCK72_016602 [Caenorhabditis remanei]KAF1750056.1 hypothetical protein GCK72_016602 [Caenorhabditis remanei]
MNLLKLPSLVQQKIFGFIEFDNLLVLSLILSFCSKRTRYLARPLQKYRSKYITTITTSYRPFRIRFGGLPRHLHTFSLYLSAHSVPPTGIKLAMCSHRLELSMRSWKYKLKKLEVELRHESLLFDLTQENNSSEIVFRDIERKPHSEPLTKISQLCDRLEKNKYSAAYIQGFSRETMLDLYNLVVSLYAPATIRWVLDVYELSRETLLRYLDMGLAINCSEISIENGDLSIERLTELMDRITVTKILKVTSWIPSDFKHPNAFKYRAI